MTCTHCGATVPDEGERCPKCLRKSGLAEPEEAVRPEDARTTKRGRAVRAIAAVVVAIGALVLFGSALRAFVMPAPSQTLAPSASGRDLDPHALDDVIVRSSRTRVEGGAFAVNLTADAGDFERTFEKLRVHVVAVTVQDVKNDPEASGAIHVFIPPRLRTADHERRIEEEEKAIRAALVKTRATSASGAAVRVTFAFGDLPDGT